jgi:transcriptional regulator with XRE-family HTH domain
MATMIDITSSNVTIEEWEREIGEAVRQLRISSGLGQVELADRANLSRSSIQALEQGRGTRLRTMLAVLRALDRSDAFESIMPEVGPTPLQVLADAQREARRTQHRVSKPRQKNPRVTEGPGA